VGDGGDEVFLGYPRHRAVLLHCYINRLPRILITAFLKILFFVPETGKLATRVRRLRQFLEAAKDEVSEAYLRWNNYCENEEINQLLNCQGKTDFQQELLDIFHRHESAPLLASSLFDLKSFVPYNLMQCADRTSMHNSLELRCPFLSKGLIEAVLNVPSIYKLHKKTNKPLLVDIFRKRLPEFIIRQKKKPFNPPMRTYMFENVSNIKEVLLSENSLLQQLLTANFLNKEIEAFHMGKVDNTKFLWGLSTLEIWLRLHYKDKNTLNSSLVH
jgi:asparagine synthase (glutamine-hydrolysing)